MTYIRQSDLDVIAAASQAQIQLARLPLQGLSGVLMQHAIELFIRVTEALGVAVERVKTEGIESSESHQILEKCEDSAEAGFADLYDILVMGNRRRHLGPGDRSDTHMDELDRYLSGQNASTFAHAARETKLAIMATALKYVDAYRVAHLAPQGIVDAAAQDYAAYKDAFEVFQGEAVDLTDARNIADAVRIEARDEYTSAREVAHAALRLSAIDRPVGDYCPSLTTILHGDYAPSDVSEEPSSSTDAQTVASPATQATPDASEILDP